MAAGDNVFVTDKVRNRSEQKHDWKNTINCLLFGEKIHIDINFSPEY